MPPAGHRLGDGRVGAERGERRIGAGCAGTRQRVHDPRREVFGVAQLHIGLDRLHGIEADAAAQREFGTDAIGDAAGAKAAVPGVGQVEDAAAGAQLVQRVVVERQPGRVVVGIDEPAGGRVDDLRHLGERQHGIGQRLIRPAGWVGRSIRCRPVRCG